MRSVCSASVLLSAFVPLALVATASANLLGDGGFELSGSAVRNPLNPLYWRSDLTAGITAPNGYAVMNGAAPNTVNPGWRSDLLAQSGTHYLLVDGPFETGKTVLESTQAIPVTSGQTYAFSSSLASCDNDAVANVVFRVEFLDDLGATASVMQGQFLAPSSTVGWQSIAFTGVAGPGATHARVVVSDATLVAFGNDFVLDSLSLNAQPVPEPASLAALSLGALALLRRRKRS